MTRRSFLAAAPAASLLAQTKRPNIVLLYADDIGFGDLSCYGAKRVQTPNLDKLASSGIRFTDAHSSAATCTPSRYSLFTGEYAWRKKGTGILPGDAKMVIDPSQATVAKTLRNAGYRTGAVGKWHLGLGDGKIDWNGQIAPGPKEIGFDYSFLIPATGDRTPCVYVENGRVVNLDPRDPIQVRYDAPFPDEPTGKANPSLLRMKPSHGHDMTIVNGISRIGYMRGGAAARWKDEEMADTITSKAVAFLENASADPFFLYFGTQDIHVPRAPHPRFAKATAMGPRGNAIAELDWSVGEIVKVLERRGLMDNTLILFSSDNGPVVDDGYQDDAVKLLGDHKPAGPWRGGKYSNFEAGTRVPLLASWRGRIPPSVSDALIGQIDLHRSLAAIAGLQAPQEEAPDSENLSAALLGQSKFGRMSLVEQANSRGLRQGAWKYIRPSGGPRRNELTNTELGTAPEPQLYDLAADPGETKNLAVTHGYRVEAMERALQAIEARGGVNR
jgi:arylsulfatase A-like enzyme